MRVLTRPAMVAFGLANLYLLALTGPLISTQHDFVYHLTGSASSFYVPVIVNLVALWLLLAGLMAVAKRPGRMRVVIWSVVLLPLPLTLLHTLAGFSQRQVPHWIDYLVGVVSVLAFILILLFRRSFLPVFRVARPIAVVVLGTIGLVGFFILAQLVWFGWQARNLNASSPLHSSRGAKAASRQRVIWILLDELSYQQVYEQRFPGVELPAFDQLAAQSTVFTHAVPVGEYTRNIIPALMTGLPADHIQTSSQGYLVATHNPATGEWRSFQQHETVFQDAIDSGYTTGVAGWYNPYCRILPEVLDRCFWTYSESIPGALSSDHSATANMVAPIRSLMRGSMHLFGLVSGASPEELADLRMHATDYRELLTAGDTLLADPTIDFVFLHMPIPHPFGFYDRRKKIFSSSHTSYIDNLALADLYLAHVRQILEQQQQWDSSAVVVMGDHSWRTKSIWLSSATWTAEDAAASHGGQFDDRPAYIVKLPNQQEPTRIDVPFDLVHTRSLMDGLMSDRFHSSEGLQSWVREQK